MPRFFFSYARQDTRDEYLDRFFGDLCRVVAGRTGQPVSEVAFRDTRGIQVGQSWPAELADALSTCHAFVAMYSPSYFDSDMCRQEWQVFADRERAYREQNGMSKPPGLLLPVLWIEPRRDQDIPSEVQYSHGDFGSTYAKEGAEYLVRLRPDRESEYQAFLLAFARRLVDAMGQHPLPSSPVPPDLRVARRSPGSGRPAGTAPAAAGPQRVRFVVLVGTEDQLKEAGVRKALQPYYGPEPLDWEPYGSANAAPLCVAVSAVAEQAGLRCSVSPADDKLVEFVVGTRERNEISVLLVDAWSLRLQRYHDLAKAYDKQYVPISAVLIPRNVDDPETAEQEEMLRRAIQFAFQQPRDVRVFRDAIPSHASLLREVKDVIVEMQRKAIELSDVVRQVTGYGVIVRPVVGGP